MSTPVNPATARAGVLPLQYRVAAVDDEAVAAGERRSGPDPGRFKFAVSSEEPYLRYYWSGAGNEVLQHDKKSIRTQRLDAGLVPNNFNHDPDRQLGAVDKYTIKDGKLTVEGPFSRSPFAQEKRQDYDDGILKAASIGYRVHKMVRTEDEDNPDAPDECRVTDWEPYDASLVTVPADPTVGVGRSANTDDFPVEVETVSRRSAIAAAPPQPAPEPASAERKLEEKPPMADTAVISNPAEQESARVKGIMAVASDSHFRKYVTIDDAQKAIGEGVSEAKFREDLFKKIVDENQASKVGTQGDNVFRALPENTQKRYSIVRLARSLVKASKPDAFGGRSAKDLDAGLELEVSQELKKATGSDTQDMGVLYPLNFGRTLGTQGVIAGAGQIGLTAEAALVETITRPEVIEMLRNRARCIALGARVIGGLQGVVRFPRQDTANVAYWTTEGQAGNPADLTTDYVSVQPRRLTQQTSWTIELLASVSPDVEGLARADLDKVKNLALDLAGLEGTGANGQPTGIANTTGLTLLSPTGTAFGDGGQPLLWADWTAFEKTVAAANADVFDMGWMVTPEVRAQARNTAKFTASGVAGLVAIWPDGKRDPMGIEEGPLGYKAAITNQLPKNGTKSGVTGSILHTALFGDWSSLIFADWGVAELVVDPYTQALNGAVVITARSLHDIAIRHIQSFVSNPYVAIS